MKISIEGHNINVGDALRQTAEENITSTVDKFFDGAIEAHAIMSKESYLHKFSISVHVGRGISFQAHADDADPYAALDKAMKKLSKRLRRSKNKMKDHSAQAKEMQHMHASEYVIYSAFANEDEDTQAEAVNDTAEDPKGGAPAVIAEMVTEIDTLSVSEAVDRLEMSRVPAILFKNTTNDELNVVYRREDGNIGWIDPKIALSAKKAS